MTARQTLRRFGAVAAAAALVLFAIPTAPASATSYRYWTYWHASSTGGWTFSPVGATYRPPNGAVEGWRFAISGTAGTTKPRMTPSFSVICAGRTQTQGKLVALVVDYGVSGDAPPGEVPPYSTPKTFCADVAVTANAYAVLALYAPPGPRSEGGLICGIHSYPKTECGVVVKPTINPGPVPQPKPVATPAQNGASRTPQPVGSTTPAGGAAPKPNASAHSTQAAAALPSTSPTAAGEASFAAAAATGAELAPASGSSSGAPVSGLVGGALVLVLGGSALVRSRTTRKDGQG